MSISPLHAADLGDPVRHALLGPQRDLGVHGEHCAAYRADVGPFVFLDDPADPAHWAELRTLVPGRTVVAVNLADELIPSDWTLLRRIVGRLMVDLVPRRHDDPELVPLGDADSADMLDLVNRTQPGPFAERTVRFGGYLGLRGPAGELRAMAGRRFSSGTSTEISAVCADPAFRGQGLARRVVHAVSAGIQAAGATPYLHVADENTPARGLYLAMGFEDHRPASFAVLEAR